MAYRRFSPPERPCAPATLANPATVCADQRPTVADFASVAGPEAKSALPSTETVAGLASVAGAEVRFSAVEDPTAYRAALANLCATCPAGVPELRWRQALADAERFLTEWGETAEQLGWTADDLFDLH